MSVEAIYDAYIAERPQYLRLARAVCGVLERKVRSEGVLGAEFEFRAKDPLSYVRKAIAKGYSDPHSEVTDAAGVRATCLYLGTCSQVESIVVAAFNVLEIVDKRELLGPDRLGYGGKHFVVELRHSRAGPPSLMGWPCEVQVRTRGEDAWARVSHETLYKGDVGGDPSLQRRINRLSAILELFDSEASSCYAAMVGREGYPRGRMIEALERNFLRVGGRGLADELTTQVVEALYPLYSAAEIENYDQVIETFTISNRAALTRLLTEYSADERLTVLSRPEALAVLERLSVDQFTLREAWERQFPSEVLERLAGLWGVRIEPRQ